MAGDDPAVLLDWAAIAAITVRLARTVAQDETPDLVVGILRGGMIPAIQLAHALGLREIRALDVTHTSGDGVNADKTSCPVVRNAASLGDLAGRDILLVDDVAGTGDTMIASRHLATEAGARTVRTAVCALNQTNWRLNGGSDLTATFTYIGARYEGWVVFPWERQ